MRIILLALSFVSIISQAVFAGDIVSGNYLALNREGSRRFCSIHVDQIAGTYRDKTIRITYTITKFDQDGAVCQVQGESYDYTCDWRSCRTTARDQDQIDVLENGNFKMGNMSYYRVIE